jgi:glycine cleavage system protein P-like pyridoxal-binding family
MCGFKVVPVACDANGNIDVPDLNAKAGRPRATTSRR